MNTRKTTYRKAKYSDCSSCKVRRSCEAGRVHNDKCRHVTWYEAEPVERLRRILNGGEE